MPYQNKTGPYGEGPMTGRGLGPCGDGYRRGFKGSCGRGFGFRKFTPQQVVLTEKEEKAILKKELEAMQTEMQEIEKRLKELK